MLLIDLNGNWKMKRTDENEYIRAVVPGSVYSDLLNAGKMDDPFYRENEAAALKIADHDFEYTRNFTVESRMLGFDSVLLRCDGLDTLCDIFLNGQLVLTASNMHRTYEANVKETLRDGENSIRVVFKSPVRYITEKQAELPLDFSEYCMHGFSYLRKAHYMFGWDWGPKLPDMGIWRNISVVGYNVAKLEDVYISQHHGKNSVCLDIHIQAKQFTGEALTASAEITAPSGAIYENAAELASGDGVIKVTIENPELWWPNGLGKQPLYQAKIILCSGVKRLDTKVMHIGLRTLTVNTAPDQWGNSFAFTINGVPFFSMGGDYIPEDNILKRCNRDKTERLIRDCIGAHFNTLRVWGGGIYPDDYFYDLCDKYGLVVWQDLMYACGVYRFTDAFRENITKETIDNVKRIRHHACLGLWCGNNEQEVGWAEWDWSDRFPPKLKADYIKQFEMVLPELVKQYDPNTFYWYSSPSSGGSFDHPNGMEKGDMHFWGVWHGLQPYEAYRDIFPRFASEFGLQSFPCLKTVQSFTLPEDRNIFSYVMESHQKNNTCNGKIMHYISENFQYPKNFDSLLYVSQLVQAEGLRYGIEHWRRIRGRCMGTLFWQVNDCWPGVSWSSIDYYGRWKALHYLAKRFYSPVLISACEKDTRVSLHITNDTMEEVSGRVSWRLVDACCQVIAESEKQVKADALSAGKYMDLDFAEILDTPEKRRNCHLEFHFASAQKLWGKGTVLFVKPKHFHFLNPHIETTIEECSDKFVIDVSSRAFAKFVELNLRKDDAVFSDNFFDISGGEQRKIEVFKSSLSNPLSLEQMRDQLSVRSLYDSYD